MNKTISLGVGLSGAYFSSSNPAQVTALVPHPLLAGRPRQISGPAGVSRTELGVHLQAAYWVRATDRVEIVVSGGPSVIRASQDFVSDVTFTEAFPYDTAKYDGATVVRERKTAKGGNIGAEVTWRASRHYGIAAVVRYSHAAADFSDAGTPTLVIGGLRAGGGIRLSF